MLSYWKDFFKKKHTRREMFLLAQNNLIDISLLLIFNILLILFIKPLEGYYDFLGGVLILTIFVFFIITRRYWSFVLGHIVILVGYFITIISMIEQRSFRLHFIDFLILAITVVSLAKMAESKDIGNHDETKNVNPKKGLMLLGISCIIASIVSLCYIVIKVESLNNASFFSIASGMLLFFLLGLTMFIKRIVIKIGHHSS